MSTGVPSASRIVDRATREVVSGLREVALRLDGQVGPFLDSALTVRQLKALGLIGVNGRILYDPNVEPVGMNEQSVLVSTTVKGEAAVVLDATDGMVSGSTYTLPLLLPAGTWIIRSWAYVTTPFVGTGNLRIGIATDGPTSIFDALVSSFTAGMKEGLQTGPTAAFTPRTTAARAIIADTTGTVTAGKLNLYVEYVTIA